MSPGWTAMSQPRHFKKALVISKTQTQTLKRSLKAIVSDLSIMWYDWKSAHLLNCARLSTVPVHLNCFHHRSHSTVLYKEGEASSHSERPCLYMPFVVRLKGVRMTLRKVHGGKALVSSCSVHTGTWIHKINGALK